MALDSPQKVGVLSGLMIIMILLHSWDGPCSIVKLGNLDRLLRIVIDLCTRVSNILDLTTSKRVEFHLSPSSSAAIADEETWLP
jgi:hypothetical protein